MNEFLSLLGITLFALGVFIFSLGTLYLTYNIWKAPVRKAHP